eukprot:1118451-Prymnesium_polylepis.1
MPRKVSAKLVVANRFERAHRSSPARSDTEADSSPPFGGPWTPCRSQRQRRRPKSGARQRKRRSSRRLL